MKQYNIAVVGATGAVGSAMLKILFERQLPIRNIYALASKRSSGQKIKFGNNEISVQDLDSFSFKNVDIALFSAGGKVSEKYAPVAANDDCIVIDNTSHFRQEKDIPLIVPEINPEALSSYTNRNIIANPNCSTIQMLMALKPIHDYEPIDRIIVSTYQAVSGTGISAVNELKNQSAQILDNKKIDTPTVYPKQIAFNTLPHIDDFTDNGYTKEELKMHNETRKILNDENIYVTSTAVRVPVFEGHAESVLIETKNPLAPNKAMDLISNFPGVQVMDNPKELSYPTPAIDAAGKDIVSVGRIRSDISNPNGLWLWIVGDNVRKGAALNSVQIAELLIEQGFEPKK